MQNEWDRDPELLDLKEWLFVTYDARTTSLEQLLEIVRKEGFEAQVVEPAEESGG